jgi:CheY-like chemotaxis protein
VLTNLCDNAIKFTAQGSVLVRVMASPCLPSGYELQVDVQDTGLGIAQDKQQRVFEAFNQADTSTTRQFGGTGLGLTICARLVGLMGGRIWLESVPAQGSTFHFTVRVQGASRSSASPEAVPDARPSTLPRPRLVLLVEDHPINQLLATTLLKKWGHEVVLARNGREAVELFPTRPWDVVLMDMQMPVMGGVEATRLIRAQYALQPRVPIIAMTANAMETDRNACLEAGMDDHLSKPFNAASLQATLERHLR